MPPTIKNPFKTPQTIQGIPLTSPEKPPDPKHAPEITTSPDYTDLPSEVTKPEGLFSDDSPYAEVRAAVRNTDGEQVANTVRAWVLGMLFVTVGSALNMFLSMRCVSPSSLF